MRELITAVIKAKNEESQITDAVTSAALLADRVLVIDDNSTDRTVAKARTAGAEVVAGNAHGGLIDKLDRQGFELVESGWILRMDADERLTSELVSALSGFAGKPGVNGVSYARLNFMFGQGVRHGGWFNPHQVGFFRADAWDRSWKSELHSQVAVIGSVEVLMPDVAFMLHFDYESVAQFIERSLMGYAQSEGRQLKDAGIKFSKRQVLVRPFLRLWGRYFLRRGYRDGDRGLVLAGLLAAYDIVRWATLWDLERQGDDVDPSRR